MKRFLILLLSFYNTWSSGLGSEYNKKDWISVENKDRTYNVTYDCSHSSNKTLELKLWSSKFPKSMKSLKVQNCERLILDTNCISDEDPIRSFNYLHILNISQLSLIGKRKETPGDVYPDTSDSVDDDLIQISSRPRALSLDSKPEGNETSTAQSELISAVRLPSNVILENINMAEFDTPLISNWLMPCGIQPGEYNFESLKLINITVSQLNTSFLWENEEDSGNMKEFVMKNVTVEKVLNHAIYLHNDKASVEITNSNFSKVRGTFADLDVSKVLISENKFGDLHVHAFKASADKFVFSKNEVATISRFAFRIECMITEIINNIIHHIEEYALYGINAPKIQPDLHTIPPQRILNISENIIHALAPSAFRLDNDVTDERSFYDVIVVTNNQITCSCQNIFWFTNVRMTYSVPERLFNYLWFNKENHNSCFNIPNCGLSQVSYNLEGLCAVDYKCPNVSLSWIKPLYGEDPAPTENTLKLSDVLINQNVTGILEDLTYLLKEDKNLTVYNNDLEFKGYLKPVFSCVLILTILLCLMFSGFVILKCLNFQWFRILRLRRRGGNLLDDTELDSSRMSLTA